MGPKRAKQAEEPYANLQLSNRDRDAFLAALANPPKPNRKLRNAMEDHRKRVIPPKP